MGLNYRHSQVVKADSKVRRHTSSDREAQSWTQRGTPWESRRCWWRIAPSISNDDWFDVSNVNLPGDIQSATGLSFDYIAGVIAWGRFDKHDLVEVCAHCGCQVLEHEVPTVYKTLGVNASEEACQVLVAQSWQVDSVKVEFLVEVEDITLGKAVWKSCWNVWQCSWASVWKGRWRSWQWAVLQWTVFCALGGRRRWEDHGQLLKPMGKTSKIVAWSCRCWGWWLWSGMSWAYERKLRPGTESISMDNRSGVMPRDGRSERVGGGRVGRAGERGPGMMSRSSATWFGDVAGGDGLHVEVGEKVQSLEVEEEVDWEETWMGVLDVLSGRVSLWYVGQVVVQVNVVQHLLGLGLELVHLRVKLALESIFEAWGGCPGQWSSGWRRLCRWIFFGRRG